ncbi:uncharacterized protein TNCV_691311 [Trichonephila clavipes]|nr:uncharacterized protein TNCV_691311 [Trichonephila clavipes]
MRGKFQGDKSGLYGGCFNTLERNFLRLSGLHERRLRRHCQGDLTSNEKSRFTECEKEDGFLFNDQALIQLNKKYSSVQVKINEVLENKRHRSDQQFEQTQERINNLQKEVSSLKNSIETVPILQYQCASYLKSKVQTENTTQTSDESHSVKKKTSNPDFEVMYGRDFILEFSLI